MNQKNKILLVEDNETSLKLLKAVYEVDYDIFTAGDGLEALEILFQYPIDLVISDVLMPNLDGYHLTYKIRTNPRLKDTPVIIYTATYISMSEEKIAREMGANIYLRKPAPTSILLSKAKELLSEPEKYPYTIPTRPEADNKMSKYSAKLISKLEQNNIELEEINEILLRRKQMLKEAQDIARIGSWEIDLQSGTHTWSDGFYKLLAVNKNNDVKASAESFLSFVHPDDLSTVSSKMKEAFSLFKNSFFHFRFIKTNGEIRYARSEWKFEMNKEGKPVRMVGVIIDLTEEKQAENEKLKLMADIIQRNKNLEQFSYIVSHNLRGPVASILGLCNVSRTTKLKSAERNKIIDGLFLSVGKLDEVITDLNQILNMNTETSDKRETISFTEIVDDILLIFKPLIEKKNAQVICNFSEIDEIKSVRVFIYSIFYNLISNSLKYHQPNVFPRVEIKSRMNKNKIELTFKDNGLGIDLTQHGKTLFGMYKRFHMDLADGKGMGLYMVRTQIESLGGNISVKSKVNSGIEFKIEL